MTSIATVEIPLPLAAECWQCGDVNYLNVVAPADIIAMAERTWCCDPCNNPDELGPDTATSGQRRFSSTPSRSAMVERRSEE